MNKLYSTNKALTPQQILADVLTDLLCYKDDCICMAIGTKAYNDPDFPNYTDADVEDVIESWPVSKLRTVVEKMIVHLNDYGDSISDAKLCPFCVAYDMNCNRCEYAQIKGKCTRNIDSAYDKISRAIDMKHISTLVNIDLIKKRLTAALADATPPLPVYKSGDIFSRGEEDELYILANVDDGRYAFIGLRSGNRWDQSFDAHDITDSCDEDDGIRYMVEKEEFTRTTATIIENTESK